MDKSIILFNLDFIFKQKKQYYDKSYNIYTIQPWLFECQSTKIKMFKYYETQDNGYDYGNWPKLIVTHNSVIENAN